MNRRNLTILAGLAFILAAMLAVSCGGPGSAGRPRPSGPTPTGSVVAFGSDAPICDVESFTMTITAASLMPESGGTAVPLITSSAPATVDFARLVEFTNILTATSGIPVGTYNELNLTVTSPQLVTLNTTTTPPSPVVVPVTLTATTFTIPLSPALVVSDSLTSGLSMDLNLQKSLQVNVSGQVTGTVTPQFTITPTTISGTTIGEATALYGVIGAPSTTSLPSGFMGSFPLTLHDGTGETLTVYSNSSTIFEGDGVTNFGELTAGNFVEVDATVNTSGQVVAKTVDSEEPTSTIGAASAFLGKIVAVSRVGLGNATSFTLLVDDEIPDLSGTVPLHSELTINATGILHLFINWELLNQQAFVFGPQTIGVGEKVAVFGTVGAGSTMLAHDVFLRPRTVVGNFVALKAKGTDNMTGTFTMTPCSALFGGGNITVLTYPSSTFVGISGLSTMTTAPTIDVTGDFIYTQQSGTPTTGGSWTGPTWVMQARGVHQLPN